MDSVTNFEPQVKQWRDVVIEHKASDLAWAKGVSGKWIEFPQGNGKSVFGLEYVIPLHFSEVEGIYKSAVVDLANATGIKVGREELQEGYEEKINNTWYKDDKIPLPNNIKRVRFINLAPQEVLLSNQRTIDTKRSSIHAEASPILLTRQPSEVQLMGIEGLSQKSNDTISQERLEALRDMLRDIFADKDKIKDFEGEISNPDVQEILIVESHGGSDNTIGEQNTKHQTKSLITHIDKQEVDLSEKQSEGNWIDLNQVVSKYDSDPNINTILVNACYLGKDDLSDRGYRSTIYRLQGLSGWVNHPLSVFLKNHTLVSRKSK